MSSTVAVFILLAMAAGCCAGAYQQACLGLLGNVFGVGPESLSLALSALCLGGAAGAAGVKEFANRSRRPLASFAFCLALAGLASLCLPLVLTFLGGVLLEMQEAAGSGSGSQKVLASVFLFTLSLPASGFSGAGLVFGIQYLRRREGIASGAGLALFAALLGAAIGVGAACVLVPIGTATLVPVAASVGMVVVAVLAAGASHLEEHASPRAQSPAEERTPYHGDRTFLLIGFIGGSAALLLFLLARLVTYSSHNGAEAGALAAAAALAGLGLGGLGATLLRHRPERMPAAAGKALALGAVLASAGAILFSFGLHHPSFGAALARVDAGRANELLHGAGLAFLFLGLPSVLIGAALTMLPGLAFEKGRSLGESIAGGLASLSLGAGLTLLFYSLIVSFTGLQSGIAVAAFVLASTGAVLLADVRGALLALVILVGYTVVQPPPLPVFCPTGSVQLLDYQEGPGQTYAVLGAADGQRSLTLDGFRSGSGAWAESETSLAHLPLCLLEKPRSVLMLGSGAVGALDAFQHYTDLQRVYALMPASYVEDGLRRAFGGRLRSYEQRSNRALLRFCHGETIPFLRSESKKWSVILSHLAWQAGNEAKAIGISSDLFRLAKRRLSRPGLFCLAVPVEVPRGILRLTLSNFVSAFPDGEVWFLQPGQVVLLGGPEPLTVKLGPLEERLAALGARSTPGVSYLKSVESILGGRVCRARSAVERLDAAAADQPKERSPAKCLRELEHGIGTDRSRQENLHLLLGLIDENPVKVDAADQTLAARLQAAAAALAHLLRALELAAGSGEPETVKQELELGLQKSPGDPRLEQASGQTIAQLRASFFPKEAEMRTRSEVKVPNLGAIGPGGPEETVKARGGAGPTEPDLPDGWSGAMGTGNEALRRGDFVRALKEYRTAEKLAPEHSEPPFFVALSLSGLGRHQEAIEKYDRVLQLDPENVEARINKGYCLSALERFTESEAVFRAILEEHPQSAIAHYNLATLLKRTERTEEAHEEYQAALDARPDYPQALFDYAVMLYKSEEYQPALELFRRFEKLIPIGPQADQARRIIKELTKKQPRK